jgi:hypothetical protein
MLFKLGRLLQFLGLVLLPIAVAGNMARPEEVTLWRSLGLSAVGIILFTLGWLLQQAVRPK